MNIYHSGQFWIFAYGSLMWNPGFAYLEKSVCYVEGMERRFWQQSLDHRGTPSQPGLVVTLVPGRLRCQAIGYRVAESGLKKIHSYLDQREQGGYKRTYLPAYFPYSDKPEQCLTYIADSDNPWFLGQTPHGKLANIIATASGPSGLNLDYFSQLRNILIQLNILDLHIEEIFKHLLKSSSSQSFRPINP